MTDSRMKWLAIIAVWAVLGVIYAGQTYLGIRAEGMAHNTWRIFGWGILSWVAWAPLTPPMIWLARRFSLIGAAWKRSLLVHFPAFVLLSMVHSAAGTVITLAVKPFDNMGDSPLAFWPRFVGRLRGSFGPDLLI